MGLLHRLRRKVNRRGKGAVVSRAPWRIPAPAPSAFRAAAGLTCVVLLATAAFWAAGGRPAQAVPTSATIAGASTTTTEFSLQGTAKTKVDALTAQANAVQAQIDALNDELDQKSELYDKCLTDLDTANARLSELRRTVADAQADQAQQEAMLAERLKVLYMTGGRDQLLELLLTANGLEDFYNRIRLVSTLADQDQELVSGLEQSSSRLDLLMQATDDQKRQELQLRDQLTTQETEIQAILTQKQQTLASLNQQVKAVIEQEKQRQAAEQARLQAEMQAQLQAAAAAAQEHVLNGGQIYTGVIPQTNNAILNQVVQTAMAYLGVPYVWGGSEPSTGMDCSGFVRYVFMQHGVLLPHYSGYMAQMGIPVDLADIQPGDLLAFGFPVHHVGIYIGDGLFINTPGDYVKIQKLSGRHDLAAIRRFPLKMRVGPPLFT